MELINSSARRLASMAAHATGAAESERLRGNAELDRGDWLKAAAHYKRAVALASSLGDEVIRAYALKGLGEAQRELGLVAQAHGSFTDALTLANALPDDTLAGWILFEFGRFDVKEELFIEAARHFELAAKRYEAGELPGDQALSIAKAAQCHAKLGRYNAAIRCLVSYFRIPRDERQRPVEFDSRLFDGLIVGLELRNRGAEAGRYRALRKELVATSDPQPKARRLPRYRTVGSELRAGAWLVGAAAGTMLVSLVGGEIVRATQLGVAGTIWLLPPILYLQLKTPSSSVSAHLLQLGVLALFVSLFVALYARRVQYRLDQMAKLFLICFGLGLGGAIANSAEGFWLGSVSDFVGIKDVRVLSIGDIAIIVGMPIAIWYIWRKW
jgi:tetratricopeptide (TPR) repeat protein